MSDDLRRRYSKVYRRIWNDARFRALSAPPPNGQTLFLRLLTGPELGTIPGLFSIGEAALAEALGWPLEGFRKAFAELAGEVLPESFPYVSDARISASRPAPEAQSAGSDAGGREQGRSVRPEQSRDVTTPDEGYREGLPGGYREGLPPTFGEGCFRGLAKADWKARLVWIPKAIQNNPPESPNVIRSWRLMWDELPECPLKLEAYRYIRAFVEGLGEGFRKAFAEAIPEGLPPTFPESRTREREISDLKKEERDHETHVGVTATLPTLAPPASQSGSRTKSRPAKAKPERQRMPRTFMSEDWQPDPKHVATAEAAGLDAEHMVDDFRTYWLNAGKSGANWQATFANEIRKVLRSDWLREKYQRSARAPSSMAIPTGGGTNPLPPLEDLRPPTPPELGLSDEPELVSQEHLDEMLAGLRDTVGKPRLQPLATVRPVDDEGEITPEFREAWERNKRERIAAARAKFGTGGGS